MNYYQHHLGDYETATSHLSLIEDAIYSRLIRLYYRREGPIPADVRSVARLIRAADQVEVVGDILAEFFVLAEDGWKQDRCDAEIAAYRERVANAQRNGMKGGRPKTPRGGDSGGEKPDSVPPEADSRTKDKPDGFSLGSEDQRWSKALQPPTSIPQPPTSISQPPTSLSQPPVAVSSDSPRPTVSRNTGALPPCAPSRICDSPPEQACASPPALAEIPLLDGTSHRVTAQDAEIWAKAYPAVDIHAALHRMVAWIQANPANRKTRRGIGRFIVGWLARDQDRARPQARGSPTAKPHFNAQIALEESNRAIAAAWRPPEFTTTH